LASIDSNPYRAPETEESQLADHSDIQPAGFLRRMGAVFLDQLIFMMPLSLACTYWGGREPITEIAPIYLARGQVIFYALWLALAPLYYAGQESSSAQATLGKRLMGIKVTDPDGRRLSFARALGRWLAASLSYLTLYVGFLMAAFTDRKRALHDMIAGTLVVDRWAYTEHPERQKRNAAGCLVALVVGLFVFGVLIAAVAIPKYMEFQRLVEGKPSAGLEPASTAQRAA
jgi:uncharacterized RDD family membrane protein YckC